MNPKPQESFCEVDENLYKIVETPEFYKAFKLMDDGTLKEVSAGRIIAQGIPVLRQEFLDEMISFKRKYTAQKLLQKKL